ncbi:MAG: GTPase Era [Bacteroidia bacterium]|nr:GTPase Era [Bacteroidia bacterium]
MHKSGYVNIVGKPNAGKSTLMNALLGEKLSVINAKVQTTRHRILGILNDENYQIIFSDTPGTVDPKYKLHERMMDYVNQSFKDADVLLLLHDAEDPRPDLNLVEKLAKVSEPVLVVLNKVDISKQENIPLIKQRWEELLPGKEMIFISALHEYNIDLLLSKILQLLPESPAYYPKDQLTDKTERFFVSEIIRGKMLSLYAKEIPYSAEIQINYFKDEPEIVKISATIFTERESQKAIILGHKGSKIKQLGIESRKDIEEFVQKKVFLELIVKVDKDWRNNESFLDRSGYV